MKRNGGMKAGAKRARALKQAVHSVEGRRASDLASRDLRLGDLKQIESETD
jgi:hypothetical protein